MVAAGNLEGAQSQVIEAATDQGVGFTKRFFRYYSVTTGNVKYLIGIAKFNESKAVNDDSTGMHFQHRVSIG